MATLSDYKGLDVVEDATGDGGIALTDNFKELADRAPFQAVSNPGANDDSTKGFAPGDQWLNTSTQVLWACVGNGTGAAVWRSILKRTATELQFTPEESGTNAATTFKGQANFPSGTSAAPSVRVGTSQTGIAELGASSLGLVASGVEMWRVGSGGTFAAVNGGAVAPHPGSTTLPGLAATNDRDTGIYWPATNTLGITAGGAERVRVSSEGLDVTADTIRLRQTKTPASSTATGNQGDICWDSGYVYICVATNTWKRAALGTW